MTRIKNGLHGLLQGKQRYNDKMNTDKALYKPGQVMQHKRYGYRGVIVAVDPECLAPEEWYQANRTQPDRNQPWYHVLVSGSEQITYPAQSSLIPDESCQPIDHPLIDHFFDHFEEGHYVRNQQVWTS